MYGLVLHSSILRSALKGSNVAFFRDLIYLSTNHTTDKTWKDCEGIATVPGYFSRSLLLLIQTSM